MKWIKIEPALIATILFLSLLLKVWGLNYDLPYIYHPDEPFYIKIIQNIFKTGDLNPHYFNYPSLFFYINALAALTVNIAVLLTQLWLRWPPLDMFGK